MRTIPGISHLLKPLDACPIFITSKVRVNGINHSIENLSGRIKNSREITKESTNEVIKNQKKKLNDAKLQEVTNKTSCKTKLRLIEASTENGASIWLTVIPIKNVFFLEKQAFWDAIRIRYDITLERLPTLCVCRDSSHLQHALRRTSNY